jgi:GAF domain-containing protein
VLIVQDVLADARFAKLHGVEERHVQEGFRSGVIVPMFGGGRVVGAMYGGAMAASAVLRRNILKKILR